MTIVYQDERIVVAVKPNGVLSTDEPGGMPSLLRQTLGTDCIRTVHRLDAQTGGLMVFARSRKAAALLSEQVRERQFSKGYLAVVHGVPQPPAGQLRDLLGRDSVRRVTLWRTHPRRKRGKPCWIMRRWRAAEVCRWCRCISTPDAPTRSGCSLPLAACPCGATGSTVSRRRMLPRWPCGPVS